ncbi:cytochrome c oxidase assembly factor Coa1 family protein [Novipirellula artificiosorum]|uniref:Cytochrome oxidase complex assembly protein 1 n=1 Tax=Novipirellula artificiosorum TaxID=2528016 RepID=A0A5C6E5C5_9BACT|nr:cytochrome c oxidase assembly factor Coa1 family protein [Novipirellula artificiosorum]TWU42801.1 Cytochrome oxidase complex assembly protein 1 [Novipirellula artificiosorum]
MSMNSDNPFQNPNAAPRNPQGQFPSGQLPQGSPPPKKSNVWLWVLGTIVVLGVVGGLVCCGGSYFMFQMGQGMMGEEITRQIDGDPTVVEQIGEIESVKMSISETANQEMTQGKPGAIAFDIQGDKGSGVLVIQQDQGVPGQPFALRSAELVLPDGTRHQLIPADNAEPSSGESDSEMQDQPEDLNDFRVRDIESPEPAFP